MLTAQRQMVDMLNIGLHLPDIVSHVSVVIVNTAAEDTESVLAR